MDEPAQATGREQRVPGRVEPVRPAFGQRGTLDREVVPGARARWDGHTGNLNRKDKFAKTSLQRSTCDLGPTGREQVGNGVPVLTCGVKYLTMLVNTREEGSWAYRAGPSWPTSSYG